MKKLNIGCGSNWKVHTGYDGLDILDFGQKYVVDIMSFFNTEEDGSWDEIMANHFLEHFCQNGVKFILKESWRILKPNGIFRFVVPHMKREKAWVLTHMTFWNETTVRWLEDKEANEVYGFGKWKVQECIVNDREDICSILVKV